MKSASDAAERAVGEIGGDWEDGGGGRCDEPIALVEPQCDDSAVWVQPSGTVSERDGADGERAKPGMCERRGVTRLDRVWGTLSNGRLDNERRLRE
ncbi:MAG: hypothetical protein IPL32_20490 [Chloracidobacterium sp.]|nr:hypothetical protein [Chloracidobacterium sp.]